ncbi:MAG: hypothetical protein AABW79_04545 [Nanoarchaeota archaeon]
MKVTDTRLFFLFFMVIMLASGVLAEKIVLTHSETEEEITPYGFIVLNFQFIFGAFCLLLVIFIIWRLL